MSSLITEIEIDGTQIEIVAEAYSLRDAALRKASTVHTVEDAFEANVASKAMADLNELVKGIEASRKAAKEPALTIGRQIDGIAKDFIADCNAELARIKRALGEYQRIEAEKKREAEREARRKEQAILDAAAEEERKRMAMENKGRTGTMLEDTRAIVDKADKEIATVRSEASQKHNAVAGVRVRTTTKFEVKDVSALLAARPDLFSPDDQKIRAALKLTKSIPGLEVWEESIAY